MKDDVDMLLDADERIDDLEQRLAEAKQERREIEARIAEEWGAIGKQSESRRGKTIYRNRDIQCSTRSGLGEQLRECLLDEGYDEFVKPTVSIQSVKAWLKESMGRGEDGSLVFSAVPSSIIEKLSIFEQVSIRVRKS